MNSSRFATDLISLLKLKSDVVLRVVHKITSSYPHSHHVLSVR